LIGGQISYAVQNVHVRNSQLAWGGLSAAIRERLSLAVLVAICRRFHECKPPISLTELASAVGLPTQILNECLNRIVDLGFVRSVPATAGGPTAELVYQPARPLNRITLLEFKSAADNRGTELSGAAHFRIEPIVGDFGAALGQLGEQEFFRKSMEELRSEEAVAK
jgi:membrane protein